jgi:hypothetical protein
MSAADAFTQGNEEFVKENWSKALEHFKRWTKSFFKSLTDAFLFLLQTHTRFRDETKHIPVLSLKFLHGFAPRDRSHMLCLFRSNDHVFYRQSVTSSLRCSTHTSSHISCMQAHQALLYAASISSAHVLLHHIV